MKKNIKNHIGTYLNDESYLIYISFLSDSAYAWRMKVLTVFFFWSQSHSIILKLSLTFCKIVFLIQLGSYILEVQFYET